MFLCVFVYFGLVTSHPAWSVGPPCHSPSLNILSEIISKKTIQHLNSKFLSWFVKLWLDFFRLPSCPLLNILFVKYLLSNLIQIKFNINYFKFFIGSGIEGLSSSGTKLQPKQTNARNVRHLQFTIARARYVFSFQIAANLRCHRRHFDHQFWNQFLPSSSKEIKFS